MKTEKGTNATLLALAERIGALDAKATSSHKRLDTLETLLREDIKELREVIAWMNRAKGWAAAALCIAGVLGGLVVKLIK